MAFLRSICAQRTNLVYSCNKGSSGYTLGSFKAAAAAAAKTTGQQRQYNNNAHENDLSKVNATSSSSSSSSSLNPAPHDTAALFVLCMVIVELFLQRFFSCCS